MNLLICILAVWRITALLTYEHGPRGVFLKLRQRWEVDFEDENGLPISLRAWVLGCFWCCSLVVSLLLWPLGIWLDGTWRPVQTLYPLAYSAGAILLNHASRCYLRMEK